MGGSIVRLKKGVKLKSINKVPSQLWVIWVRETLPEHGRNLYYSKRVFS